MARRTGPVVKATAVQLALDGQVWGQHNGYRVLWWAIDPNTGHRRQVTAPIVKAIADSVLDVVPPAAPSCSYGLKAATTD
jgi:hypothetical protein